MWQICGVCGYPLEHAVDRPTGEELGWLHARPSTAADHIVVPVDADQLPVIEQRCDFCDAQPVTDAVLCTSFVMPLPGPPQKSIGHWAACTPCAELVRRRRWSQLVTRSRQLNPEVMGDMPRKLAEDLFGAVERHMVEVVTLEEWRERMGLRPLQGPE